MILTKVISAIILILSGGFAFPVLFLFKLQLANFLTGLTSIERLGKLQGQKVALASQYSVNEPLASAATPLIETRFLYREMVRDA